jgi:hypothetical protein
VSRHERIRLVRATSWVEGWGFEEGRVSVRRKMKQGKVAMFLPLGSVGVGEAFDAAKAFDDMARANGYTKKRRKAVRK